MTTMTMPNRCRAGLAALLGLSVMAAAARAGEEKISPDKLPAAVKKAVKKKFPEAEIRGAAKEVEGGKTTFEVEMTVEGRMVDIAVSPKGKILEVEKEVPVAKLPKAVKKALKKKYPGAEIEKAETVTKGEDGPVRYEVVIKAEVVLTAKGKVVQAKEEDEEDEKPAAKAKKKKEKEEDEDDDDDEDDEKSVKAKKAEKKQDKDDDDDDDEDDDEKSVKAKKAEKKQDKDDDDDEDDDEKSVKAKKAEKKQDKDDDDDDDEDDNREVKGPEREKD
jgi:hypothetical protein